MGHVVQYMGKLNVRTMFSTIFIMFMMYTIILGSKALLLLQSGQCQCSGGEVHLLYDS